MQSLISLFKKIGVDILIITTVFDSNLITTKFLLQCHISFLYKKKYQGSREISLGFLDGNMKEIKENRDVEDIHMQIYVKEQN